MVDVLLAQLSAVAGVLIDWAVDSKVHLVTTTVFGLLCYAAVAYVYYGHLQERLKETKVVLKKLPDEQE